MASSSSSAAAGTTAELYSLKLWNWKPEMASVEVANFEDLGQRFGFWFVGAAKELVKFQSDLVVNRTEEGKRQTVKLDFQEKELGYCHTWVHPSGLACTCITNTEYNMRVAYQLIQDMMTLFAQKYPANEWKQQVSDCTMGFPECQQMFDRFKKPEEADKILKIEKELEIVKDTVMATMDDLLNRGESIDSMVSKSKHLSDSSKILATTARKNNQCCQYY